jgi:membrane protein DedA with SNARE-associated domain
VTLIGIILATFVSEDLTCITVGLAIGSNRLSWMWGLLGCYIGIVAGDLGLWLLGRGAALFAQRSAWVQARIEHPIAKRTVDWFERHPFKTVFFARFAPGTRAPVYFAAGFLKQSGWRFLLAVVVACVLWTPTLVLMVAWIGEPIRAPLERYFGAPWLAIIVVAVAILLVLRLAYSLSTEIGRLSWIARISRIWRWEFWPVWFFYLPLLPWIVYLAWRYGGLTTPAAANPAIPHGGVVGESKWEILQALPQDWIVPSTLIPSGEPAARLDQLREIVEQHGWSLPIILKPNQGERGAGLKLLRDWDSSLAYFEQVSIPVVAQTYHPGPFEAGIFYVRRPGETRGKIFSITDKHFPEITGDGESTLEMLIWRHPRLRMQARRFLERLGEAKHAVPAAGETRRLAIAGNHCQGTLFADGSHLITRELEATVDEIARQFEGFYYGRFDVRYCHVDEFRAGRGFKIIELNGVTSESTNIYDPSWSLWKAYRVLARQLAWAYEIGAANRAKGPADPNAWRSLADSA